MTRTAKTAHRIVVTCDPEGRLRRVPLADLKRFQGSMKTLHKDQYAKLRESLETKGFFAPIFLWAGHNFILDGHQRLNVLEHEQWDIDGGVPVVDIEAADEQDAAEKLLLLSSTYGKIDPQGLYEFTEMHAIPLTEFKLPDLPDFDFNAYQVEYYQDATAQENGDPDAAPDVPVEPVTQPGDLWIMGDHRLLCGDCTVATNIERLMNGEQADLFISDPPYGVGWVEKAQDMAARGYGHSRAKVARLIDNDSRTETDEDIGDFLQQTLALWWTNYLKPGGCFYLCSPPGNTETTFRNVISGFSPIRQCLVWVKNNFVIGRQDYHWKHEPILYGWKEGRGHFFAGPHNQCTIWEISRDGGEKVHPTMKPVELFSRMIINSSRKDELICDPFLGSGTLTIAAERSQRRSNGMEIQPAYCDVIVRRWQDYTGQSATLDGDGRMFAEIADNRVTSVAT